MFGHLVRALACDPEIMLFPTSITSALDPELVGEVLECSAPAFARKA